MGIPFYIGFSLLDSLYVPSRWAEFFLIRLVSCVLFALIVGISRLAVFSVRHTTVLCHFGTTILGLGIGYMCARTGGLESPYYAGLNWVVIGSVAFWPVRSIDLLVSIATIYGPLFVFVSIDSIRTLAHPLAILNVTFMGGACLLSVITNGFAVRSLRREFDLRNQLAAEKDQSESLLKEILPRYVIQRIREGADTIAESLSEVNVIFIDIVGFTSLSRRLAPKHLIEVLSTLFQSFDGNCERFGVTKIKTIGDAYMAVTGAPEPATLSAVAAIDYCFEAINAVDAVAAATGIPIQIRAGVATGAVISGVLSLKRPAYDLWGETVNLASRMEHSSEAGRVHISESTYWRVKDNFACEPRESIELKGMGRVSTYYVNRPKAAAASI